MKQKHNSLRSCPKTAGFKQGGPKTTKNKNKKNAGESKQHTNKIIIHQNALHFEVDFSYKSPRENILRFYTFEQIGSFFSLGVFYSFWSTMGLPIWGPGEPQGAPGPTLRNVVPQNRGFGGPTEGSWAPKPEV